MLRYIASAFILLSINCMVHAEIFEEALAAAEKKGIPAIVKISSSFANKGNAKAQSNLGGFYLSGVGVSRDYTLKPCSGFAKPPNRVTLMDN